MSKLLQVLHTGSPYNVRGVWEDWVIGLVLVVIALSTLCFYLDSIVNVLMSIFREPIVVVIKKVVNSDCPGTNCHPFTSIQP